MIRSFGDLSNNWMTRTFRELQHLGRKWWYGDWQTGGYQSYITVNMEHQREAWQQQREMKTQRRHCTWIVNSLYSVLLSRSYERVSDTKRASSSTQTVEKKKSLGADVVTKKCWQYAKSWKSITTAGHHVYCYRYEERQSWYPYLGVTFGKRHTWKPHMLM